MARTALRSVVLPLWRNTAQQNAHEKTPGELVTAADVDCQKFLEAELHRECPDARFLGEELLDEEQLDLSTLHEHEKLWIVDPLDGTKEFATGSAKFAVMIAYAENGVVKGAWIAMPRKTDSGDIVCSVAHAVHGGPACIDGVAFMVKQKPFPHNLKGIVGLKYFPKAVQCNIKAVAEALGGYRPPCSAGVDVVALAMGEVDFWLLYRTLPWDFAAPLLWARQAGLIARRFSGAAVRLGDGASGWLCARNVDEWRRVHAHTLAQTPYEEWRKAVIEEQGNVAI